MDKTKKIVISLLLFCIMMLHGCTNNVNFIVRFNIDKSEIDCLYQNMTKNDVMSIFGLPHISNDKSNISTYDYSIEDELLRLVFENNKLYKATLFGNNDPVSIRLSEEKNVETDKIYYKEINKNINNEDLEFLDNKTNSDELQETLGPPHKIKKSLDGTGNAFTYELNDGNILFILYKSNGLVAMAWVEDKKGVIIEEIIERGA